MARQPTGNRDSNKTGEFEERVVTIRRCSKVVKGGRNFSFSALVVVGNRKGKVGVGLGKAPEVAEAIRKGTEQAKKNLTHIPHDGHTLPHEIEAKFRGGHIWMKPAAPGTGIIAGNAMRAVLELGGIRDVLAKSLGSNNVINVVRATMKGIAMLTTRESMQAKRYGIIARPANEEKDVDEEKGADGEEKAAPEAVVEVVDEAAKAEIVEGSA